MTDLNEISYLRFNEFMDVLKTQLDSVGAALRMSATRLGSGNSKDVCQVR